MRIFPVLSILAVSAFAAVEASASPLDACGNIDISASANCKVYTQGGCTAQCTPINVDLACNAQLEASCNGGCNVSADVMCTTSCEGSCTTQCNANPGSFDCSGSCNAQCSADCDGQCSSSSNMAQCKGSCSANCSADCSAQCKATPPSATCMAKCQASCTGSCTAKINAQCQIMCQAMGMAKCEADVTGGCKAQCTKPDGAIFCDGHYVDVGNNFQNCLNALNAILNVKVDASASCMGNTCTGMASASCGSVAPGEPALGGTGILVGLGAVAVGLARRRTKKK